MQPEHCKRQREKQRECLLVKIGTKWDIYPFFLESEAANSGKEDKHQSSARDGMSTREDISPKSFPSGFRTTA